jgi:hypothetical protein
MLEDESAIHNQEKMDDTFLSKMPALPAANID